MENIRIAEMVQNKWNGDKLTPMKIVHTVYHASDSQRTILSFPERPSSEYLITALYSAPSPPECIHHFSSIRPGLKAPFKVTVKGMICDVQNISESQAGHPKRLFDIVDKSGCWMHCCAMGRNAGSKALVAGCDVVVYHSTGRAPLGESFGMLYLLKDAVIVPLGGAQLSVAKRTYYAIE
jgi:hypothetical protein